MNIAKPATGCRQACRKSQHEIKALEIEAISLKIWFLWFSIFLTMLVFFRSEDLQNFLISVNQQCCYLTETIQDVISRFPRQASQVRVIYSALLVEGLPLNLTHWISVHASLLTFQKFLGCTWSNQFESFRWKSFFFFFFTASIKIFCYTNKYTNKYLFLHLSRQLSCLIY